MIGVQKERFQHLVAVSVMDIWRKETGSQLPVFLEGTICITSCSGRMTVVQLSNRCPIFQNYPLFNQSPTNSPIADASPLNAHSNSSTAGDRDGGVGVNNDDGGSSMSSRCRLDGHGGGGSGECGNGGCEKGGFQGLKMAGRSIPNRVEVVDENNNELCYESCGLESASRTLLKTDASPSDEDEDDVFVDDVEDDKISVCDGSDDDDDVDEIKSKERNSNNNKNINDDYDNKNEEKNNGREYLNNKKEDNNINSNNESSNNDSAIQDMSFNKKDNNNNDNHSNNNNNNHSNNNNNDNHSKNNNNNNNSHRELSHINSQAFCSTQQLSTQDRLAFSAQIHNNFKNFLLSGNSLLNSNSIFNHKVHFSPAQRELNDNVASFGNGSVVSPHNNINNTNNNANNNSAINTNTDNNNYHNNNDNAQKSNTNHWPIKMETNNSSANQNEDKKYPSQSNFMPFLPPFIPAAHSSNLFNHFNGLPALLAAHSSAVANRSFSVPAYSPPENRPFDLIGQLKNNQPANRSDSSSAPASSSSEQKIYRCLYCHKTFLFKSKYHEHLPVHTSARPFQCHLCSRTYKYKYDLRVHLRTHLGIPTKSTICPFCSVKFSTNKHLRQHIREEHNEQQRISDQQCAQSLLLAPQAHA